MRRQLTVREGMMLTVMAVLVLGAAYLMLFYRPMQANREICLAETEAAQTATDAAKTRLEDMQRMQQELTEIFADGQEPVSIPEYDNLQAVMFELNTVLAGAEDYKLAFGTVDTAEHIVRRSVSVSFSARSYAAAKAVLQRLHDSKFRCMLDGVSIDISRQNGQGYVEVNAEIVYFEYQAQV